MFSPEILAGVLYGVKYCRQKVRQKIRQKISAIKTNFFDDIQKQRLKNPIL